MASASPTAVMAGCAAAAAIACGVGMADLAQPDSVLKATFDVSPGGIGYVDAVRLAKQATFGPTVQNVNQIVDMGLDPWLDAQFAAKTSTYADLAKLNVARNYCATKTGTEATICNRDYFSATYPAMRFYANAVGGDDQLRQRVALALGETIVASELAVHTTAGVATFHQIFLDNAFGNYRDILKAVTLNPFMGIYLNLADSNRTAPNENYAREVMQLFSLGVNQMNADGTLKLDAKDAPIATYTSTDVREIARALTGWTYARLGTAAITDGNQLDYSQPMIQVAARYDTAAKTFLGRTVPANASQAASVDAVVDTLFAHANTAPFVSMALIKQLVTSNPSPAYVGRVSKVFADNGAGVRGDLKAVVRAILKDPEARGSAPIQTAGKVKEPILYLTGLARILADKTDGYVFTVRDAQLGQSVFHAPSVFNFYPPDYPLPLGDGLESGPSKLMTTATVIARHNLAYDWTVTGDQASRTEYNPVTGITGATGTQVDWSQWEQAGADVDAMIDRINLLMLSNEMTAAQRATMKAAMIAVTNTDPAVQARRRAQTAIYIAATSPLYQTDR